VAIREGHRIVRAGPYRLLRHPSYTGYLLAMLGIGIALNNWIALLVMAGANLAIYNYRMSVEESALAEAFGESYFQYKRETKRIIPFIY
jgi:protein-S-isoprenylcysteine O-methyltransferase Ste14